MYIFFWIYYLFRIWWVFEDFGDESVRDIDMCIMILYGWILIFIFFYFVGRRV